MAVRPSVIVLSILAFSFIFSGFVSADLNTEYSNSAYLDEAKTYKLYWRIDNGKEMISFAVEVKTLGWVGFGISSGNGNMVGSDVVIGWVKNNKGYMKDRYADALSLPVIDDKQDYDLTAAYEQNGKTVLKFSRKYDTCDKKDVKIEGGTVRVVYSYHSDDPDSDSNIPKHQVKGSRSLILRNILLQKPKLPNNLQSFDMRLNTTIQNRHTTYICKPFKIPQFNGSKRHVVKISPVITPGNEGMVHHILVYGCKDDFPESNLTVQGRCYSPNMPEDIQSCVGAATIAAWAIGGSDFYFPDHVGYPIGDELSVKYVVMEVHYDNPDKKSGVEDMSGLRFHYTSSLRQYDASVIWVGWGVTSALMIPPKQKDWTSVGYCPSECTKLGLQESSLPEKGIKVFASLLHAHLLGAALWTKHIRNGKELPEITRDNHYDFNFQEYQVPLKETHILPGDDIIQYCKYDSSKRSKAAYGGLSTNDEMCLAFLYYYPRVNLTKCVSNNYVGQYNFRKQFYYPNATKMIDVDKVEWKSEWTDSARKEYDSAETVYLNCLMQKAESLKPINGKPAPKPKIKEPLKIPNNCPTPPPPESDGVMVSSNMVVVAMVASFFLMMFN